MTTSRECRRNQEDLTDVFYNENGMNGELEGHLKNCQQCRTHWESLHDLKQEFSLSDNLSSIDSQAIKQAFQIADERVRLKRERMEFIFFVTLITVLMACVVYTAAVGYGAAIIIALTSFGLLTPFVVPLLFITKLRGEDA